MIFVLTNMDRVDCISSPNKIFVCVQITNSNVISSVCRQVRVPRMSVGGVGAALFMKVGADILLIVFNWRNAFFVNWK
jgi:hypothetical protein